MSETMIALWAVLVALVGVIVGAASTLLACALEAHRQAQSDHHRLVLELTAPILGTWESLELALSVSPSTQQSKGCQSLVSRMRQQCRMLDLVPLPVIAQAAHTQLRRDLREVDEGRLSPEKAKSLILQDMKNLREAIRLMSPGASNMASMMASKGVKNA